MNNEEISKLNNNQLSRKIALQLGEDVAERYLHDVVNVVLNGNIVDYCGNWNDLMPLVVEYGIAFGQISYENENGDKIFQAGRWTLPFERLESHTRTSRNPQRALAECLLLVLQDKENKE